MIFARRTIDDALWREALGEFPIFDRLSEADIERLKALAEKFVRRKSIEGAQGLEIDAWMEAEIAAQACLPVLGLDLDYYRGWRSLIVHPGGFLVRHSYEDEDGVVHELCEERIGEAWEEGPVIVSWEDIDASRRGGEEGVNVIIHELAHKLDALNGTTNGMPPLHRDMDPARWSSDWSEAYEALCRRTGRGAGAAHRRVRGGEPRRVLLGRERVLLHAPRGAARRLPPRLRPARPLLPPGTHRPPLSRRDGSGQRCPLSPGRATGKIPAGPRWGRPHHPSFP